MYIYISGWFWRKPFIGASSYSYFWRLVFFTKCEKQVGKKNTGLQRFLQTAVRHRAAHPQSLISEGIHKEQHRDPQCWNIHVWIRMCIFIYIYIYTEIDIYIYIFICDCSLKMNRIAAKQLARRHVITKARLEYFIARAPTSFRIARIVFDNICSYRLST